MAASSAHNARFLLGGTDISLYLSSATASSSTEMLDSTSLNDTAHRRTAGLNDATFTLEGWTEAAAQAIFTTSYDLAELFSAVPLAATYAPQGLAFGSPCVVSHFRRASYESGSEVNGLNNFSFQAQADGPAGNGVILHALTAETADGNGTSYDRGITSSASGAVANIHTTAFSGLTNNVVTIEDSANDSVWSTIGTFPTVTATGSERLSITGTVRRYVRAVTNVTGTGSTTFAVSFAPL